MDSVVRSLPVGERSVLSENGRKEAGEVDKANEVIPSKSENFKRTDVGVGYRMGKRWRGAQTRVREPRRESSRPRDVTVFKCEHGNRGVIGASI